MFRICFRHGRQPAPPGPPGLGYGGRGRRRQNSVACPRCGPSWGRLDPRHAGLGRVSAGRGAAGPAGPGISGGFARTPVGTRQGLRAGPGGRGTPPLATSRVLLATWRRPGAISSLSSHFIPAGHVRPGAGPGCSCPRNVAPARMRVLPDLSPIWCTFAGRFVRFACTRSVISGRRRAGDHGRSA